MMSSGHITMGWGNMGKQLSIHSPKEHLAWRRLSDLVPWLLPWGKRPKTSQLPRGWCWDTSFGYLPKVENGLGSRLDVVVGHVRHQCFLFGLLQVCRTHLLRECHEWGLWHLRLRYRTTWLKHWNFSTKLGKFPGESPSFFEGNVTIEWEGEFGRDVHQNHAELVLKRMFLEEEGDSWPKKIRS